jgi:drug/metabolite transporter (DMT)-like permease
MLPFIKKFFYDEKAMVFNINRQYFQMVFWTVFLGFACVLNDVLMRIIWTAFPHITALSQTVSLAPLFVFYSNLLSLVIHSVIMLFSKRYRSVVNPRDIRHVIRAAITTIAFLIYRYSQKYTTVFSLQILCYAIPLVSAVFSSFLLKERGHWSNYIFAVFGSAVVILLNKMQNPLGGLAVIFSFALAEVYIKYMFQKKPYHFLDMIYCFYLYSTLFSAYAVKDFVIYGRQVFTLPVIACFAGLSLGDMMIQWALCHALSANKLVSILPFRYSPLIFAFLFDKILFGESNFSIISLVAILIISIGAFFTQYYIELKKNTGSYNSGPNN